MKNIHTLHSCSFFFVIVMHWTFFSSHFSSVLLFIYCLSMYMHFFFFSTWVRCFLWHKNFFLRNHFFPFELLSQLFIILILLSFSAVCAIIETIVTQPWLFVHFYFRLMSSIYQYTSPICFMIWTVLQLLPLN